MQKQYRYIKFGISAEIALENLNRLVNSKSIPTYITVRSFDPDTDANTLVETYNRSFLASNDPYTPIFTKEVSTVDPEGVLVAIMYNKMIGFTQLKVHEENAKKIGEIAILGVIPEKRRQGVATALAIKISEFFIKKEIQELQCEVYEHNPASLFFIKSFGFKKIGERIAVVDFDENEEDKESKNQDTKHSHFRPKFLG